MMSLMSLFEIPFFAFCILLFLGREDFGLKGIAVAIVGWLALPYVFDLLGIAPSLLVSAQALVDVALVLIVFKGNPKLGDPATRATLRGKLLGRRDEQKPDESDPL